MKFAKPVLSLCCLVFFLMFFTNVCVADSIGTTESPDVGSPLDPAELAGLGLDPASFLFTLNDMYDYTGTTDLSILTADVNPGDASSLSGVDTQTTNIVLPLDPALDGGSSLVASEESSQSLVPETGTLVLMAAALGCFVPFALRNRLRIARSGTGCE
jgi:hypothetical protein